MHSHIATSGLINLIIDHGRNAAIRWLLANDLRTIATEAPITADPHLRRGDMAAAAEAVGLAHASDPAESQYDHLRLLGAIGRFGISAERKQRPAVVV